MHAAYILIDSSQGCLARTLARLPDMRKSTSDLISPLLARYDLKKKKTFSMTVEPSNGRKGGRFRMMDEPSYRHERVKLSPSVFLSSFDQSYRNMHLRDLVGTLD